MTDPVAGVVLIVATVAVELMATRSSLPDPLVRSRAAF
jgi:hypothetical protein